MGLLIATKHVFVAKRFHQRYGLDYAETFSPVIKTATIRFVLSITIQKQWSIKQLDINNSFLNANLSKTVYMSQPQGCVYSNFPAHKCHLKKSLYGHTQVPREWSSWWSFYVNCNSNIPKWLLSSFGITIWVLVSCLSIWMIFLLLGHLIG